VYGSLEVELLCTLELVSGLVLFGDLETFLGLLLVGGTGYWTSCGRLELDGARLRALLEGVYHWGGKIGRVWLQVLTVI